MADTLKSALARIASLEARLKRHEEIERDLERYITLCEQADYDRARASTRAVEGRNGYIPLARASFIQVMQTVKHLLKGAFPLASRCDGCGSDLLSNPSFVDIGSGLGDKVRLASMIGFEAHGIEVDRKLIRAAERRCALRVLTATRYTAPQKARAWLEDTLTVYAADALAFDYSEFDVVYCYQPIRDQAVEARLEQIIWRQAKPGAFVIAGAAATTPPAADYEVVDDMGGLPPPQFITVYRRRSEPRGPKRTKRPARRPA